MSSVSTVCFNQIHTVYDIYRRQDCGRPKHTSAPVAVNMKTFSTHSTPFTALSTIFFKCSVFPPRLPSSVVNIHLLFASY